MHGSVLVFEDMSVVLGQGGSLQSDEIETVVLERDGRVLVTGLGALHQNVLDITGAVGSVRGGVVEGVDEGLWAVVVQEGEEFFEGFFHPFS